MHSWSHAKCSRVEAQLRSGFFMYICRFEVRWGFLLHWRHKANDANEWRSKTESFSSIHLLIWSVWNELYSQIELLYFIFITFNFLMSCALNRRGRTVNWYYWYYYAYFLTVQGPDHIKTSDQVPDKIYCPDFNSESLFCCLRLLSGIELKCISTWNAYCNAPVKISHTSILRVSFNF